MSEKINIFSNDCSDEKKKNRRSVHMLRLVRQCMYLYGVCVHGIVR